MADYFTKFSIVIPFKREQIDYAIKLYKLSQELTEESGFDALPPVLANDGDYTERLPLPWNLHDEKDSLWFDSYEGGVDSCASFISHLLDHFDDDGVVIFEWSNDCSKPRTDAYGGGAMRVSRKTIKHTATSQQVYEWRSKLKDCKTRNT